PWLDRLQSAKRLQGGLAALTAAVVGVIANLSLWFAIHVLFARVTQVDAGPLHLGVPDLASFDWRAGLLALVAGVLLIRFKWGVLPVLAVAAGGGLALQLAGV
ncbi:MAG: chromate transporter, partial [Sphingomonas sp.]